jgi:formamidopyrimidine-DNA glycosylase
LIDWGDHVLLNHLGMTGSWRRLSGPQDLLPHDHVLLDFGAHGTWVFHDPRRFGFFDLHPAAEVEQCRWLKHLGPDPWPQPVSGTELFQRVRNRSGTIKSLIMDQSVLTGVGNIYASEALFQARLRPQRKGKSLREPDLNRLVASIRSVLEVAISHGGSTIRDYRSASGERGSFQNQLFVYGRAGEPCRRCSVPIREVRLAGRSTFWCSQCQS